ncbi:hypothetical protein HK099_000433 [Clydaea vesicula]|uniref:RING-type domain-containing protein n=1 Tax=Clydaea vesicula TaxID=447962 RepID=A0AAD5Y3Z4_9FUNG|nr:hypothetical protein HK099_000433 [Clydaea vesicula]
MQFELDILASYMLKVLNNMRSLLDHHLYVSCERRYCNNSHSKVTHIGFLSGLMEGASNTAVDSQDLCHRPVISLVCHHSFCKGCIHSAIIRDNSCPLCRAKLRQDDLHPNLALAQLIGELYVNCTYKKYGCKEAITLDSIAHHEKICSFAPASCEHAARGYIEQTDLRICALEELVKKQVLLLEEVRRECFADKKKASIYTLPSTEPPGNLWPLKFIECKKTLEENKTGVTALTYHNNEIFSGSYDGSTKIYNAKTGELTKSMKGHELSVWSLAIHSQSSQFFSAGSDGTINVWDLFNSSDVSFKSIKQHKGKVYSLSIIGDRLYSASSDRTIKIWDIESLECIDTLHGHTEGINSIIPIDNHRIASAACDGTIWDLETTKVLKTIDDLESEVLDLTLSSNNLLIASTYDAHISCYSLTDFSRKSSMEGHNWEVWQVESSDGVLFSGSFDHTIKRWDLRNFKCFDTLHGHRVHKVFINY